MKKGDIVINITKTISGELIHDEGIYIVKVIEKQADGSEFERYVYFYDREDLILVVKN